MLHVAQRIRVAGQDLVQQQDLDAVALEHAQHGVVVGHEPVAVDGPREVELPKVLRRDLVQLPARTVHQHPLQVPVRRVHTVPTHRRPRFSSRQ